MTKPLFGVAPTMVQSVEPQISDFKNLEQKSMRSEQMVTPAAAHQNTTYPVTKQTASHNSKIGIDIRKSDQVMSYGADAQANIAQFADKVLEQVKTSSVATVGPKLTEIVTLAKGLNISELNGTSSKIPIIGKFIDSISARRAKFTAKFNSLKDQIDTIVKELDTTSSNLVSRNQLLDQMYDHTISEYNKLEKLISDGKIYLTDQVSELATAKQDAVNSGKINDPLMAQDLADWEDSIKRFEKQIAYLEATQMMAVHAMPEIRLIQKNNLTLVEKFQAAKTHTIPAWKKQFILATTLEEQRQAGALATSIDDATNHFYKQNADLLKQNAVTVAKANERNVIDLSTLEYMQNSLISTFDEMSQIEKEGSVQRAELTGKLTNMKQELYQKLVLKQ